MQSASSSSNACARYADTPARLAMELALTLPLLSLALSVPFCSCDVAASAGVLGKSPGQRAQHTGLGCAQGGLRGYGERRSGTCRNGAPGMYMHCSASEALRRWLCPSPPTDCLCRAPASPQRTARCLCVLTTTTTSSRFRVTAGAHRSTCATVSWTRSAGRRRKAARRLHCPSPSVWRSQRCC